MQTQNQIRKSFLIASIISLLLAFLCEILSCIPYRQFLSGVFLGIFGSGLVAFVTADIMKRDEAKSSLLRLGVLSANAANSYAVCFRTFNHLECNNSSVNLMVTNFNNLYIRLLEIRHEIIQLDLADAWRNDISLHTDITDYIAYLCDVADQCKLLVDYIFHKVDSDNYTFERTKEREDAINADHSKQLTDYVMKFDEHCGQRFAGKKRAPKILCKSE